CEGRKRAGLGQQRGIEIGQQHPLRPEVESRSTAGQQQAKPNEQSDDEPPLNRNHSASKMYPRPRLVLMMGDAPAGVIFFRSEQTAESMTLLIAPARSS